MRHLLLQDSFRPSAAAEAEITKQNKNQPASHRPQITAQEVSVTQLLQCRVTETSTTPLVNTSVSRSAGDGVWKLLQFLFFAGAPGQGANRPWKVSGVTPEIRNKGTDYLSPIKDQLF